jgi:methionyl-tRNA formyltransferase
LRRGSLSGREQNLEEGCYWHVLKNEDGKIDWSRMTAEQVVNHVRAFSFPYDGAFSYLDNEKISFIKAQECKELFKGLPGRICAIRNNGVVVIAKDCGLLIQSVKRGNEEVPAKEILKIGNNLL